MEIKDNSRSAIGYVRAHSFLYLVGRGAAAIVNLLSVTIFARLVGADGYGLYTLVMSGVAIANTAVFQWLRIATVRYFPFYCEEQKEFISIVVNLFVINFVLFSLIYISFLFVNQLFNFYTLIFLAILLLQAWFDLCLELSRVRLRPGYYSMLLISKSLLSLLTGIILISLGWGCHGILVGQFLGLLISGGLTSTQQIYRAKLILRSDVIRQMARYGIPISFALSLSAVVSYTDRFLIAMFVDQRSAGTYAAIYDLVSSHLLFAMQIPTLAGFPLAVQAYQRGDFLSCQQVLNEAYLTTLRYSVPLMVAIAWFSHSFVSLTLGGGFAQAHVLAKWVCLSMMIYGLTEYYYNRSFWLVGDSRYLLGVMGTAAVVNGLLNLIFIPYYGMVGAAGATVAAYVSSAVISAIFSMRVFPLPSLVPRLYNLAIASLLMVFVLAITNSWEGIGWTVLRIALGVGVYWMWLLSRGQTGRRKREVRKWPT